MTRSDHSPLVASLVSGVSDDQARHLAVLLARREAIEIRLQDGSVEPFPVVGVAPGFVLSYTGAGVLRSAVLIPLDRIVWPTALLTGL